MAAMAATVWLTMAKARRIVAGGGENGWHQPAHHRGRGTVGEMAK